MEETKETEGEPKYRMSKGRLGNRSNVNLNGSLTIHLQICTKKRSKRTQNNKPKKEEKEEMYRLVNVGKCDVGGNLAQGGGKVP